MIRKGKNYEVLGKSDEGLLGFLMIFDSFRWSLKDKLCLVENRIGTLQHIKKIKIIILNNNNKCCTFSNGI